MVTIEIQEMGLIPPYLEAQGVKTIAELPARTGTPPVDDPQMFLGSLVIDNTYKEDNLLLKTY